MLSQTEGLLLFAGYGIVMIAIVIIGSKERQSLDDFLLMQRNLGVFRGSLSMAVSWIWAPAIFICSLQAYEQGIPGVFWFTVPNILTFFVFAFFAVKMREKIPEGYAISDVFRFRFPDTPFLHASAKVVTFGYQLGAIIINCVAGATLINLLSGIQYEYGVLLMAGLSLAYSLLSGLRASVISDVAQMGLILTLSIIIVPWVLIESGGLSSLKAGLGGVSGEYDNLFNWQVAYAFGIATTLGLISGPIADQMFSQRAFAAKRNTLVKIFIFSGLIFGIVPIVLSILGFIGAGAEREGFLVVENAQMVGPQVISHFLPNWALALFAVMAFAGLTSTLDSAFTAIGSLSADKYKNGDLASKSKARLGMSVFAFIGVAIALLNPKLLWVFLIYGALASSIFIPSFLALHWKKLSSRATSIGITLSIAIGIPLSVYANVNENSDLIVLSAIVSFVLSGVICWAFSLVLRDEN